LPNTTISTIEQTVKMMVFNNERQNTGSRQCDALSFTAGQLSPAAVEQVIDAEQLRGPASLAFAFCPIELDCLERKDNVVENRLVRVQRIALKHHGDAAQSWRQAVDDIAADQHITVGRVLEAGDGTQQRGLAAAGRAQQDEILALAGREVDAIDRFDVPVSAVELFREIAYLNDSHSCVSPFLSCSRIALGIRRRRRLSQRKERLCSLLLRAAARDFRRSQLDSYRLSRDEPAGTPVLENGFDLFLGFGD
jgi:hypothetical protein